MIEAYPGARDHRFTGIHKYDPKTRTCLFCGITEILSTLLIGGQMSDETWDECGCVTGYPDYKHNSQKCKFPALLKERDGLKQENSALRNMAVIREEEKDALKAKVDELRSLLETRLAIAKTSALQIDTLEKKVKELNGYLNDVLYAQLGGHLDPSESGKSILNKIRNNIKILT